MNKITLNGEITKTAAISIVELLQELELSPSTVLVEQNSLALYRHELEKASLTEGDRIEILKVAAGG